VQDRIISPPRRENGKDNEGNMVSKNVDHHHHPCLLLAVGRALMRSSKGGETRRSGTKEKLSLP